MYKTRLCLGVLGGPYDKKEQIKIFKKVGFDGFFTGWSDSYNVGEFRALADELGMIYQSIHAPFEKSAVMWGEGAEADEAVDELIRCVRDCAKYNVPIMVVHAFIGFEDHTPNEHGIINYGKVVEEASKLGVKIAFENTEGEEHLAALMDAFQDCPNVGFCWDTGHQMCYNHSKDMMELYGDRLLCTHLNDNLGISDFDGKIFWTDDLHILPFDGIGDWEDIAKKLNRHSYKGELTFELNLQSKPGKHENDIYKNMPFELYVTEAYKRACRIAALKQKNV